MFGVAEAQQSPARSFKTIISNNQMNRATFRYLHSETLWHVYSEKPT